MNRADFALLLEHVNRVPAPPRVIRALMIECEAAEADVERIARLLGTDPVPAARLLRLVGLASAVRFPADFPAQSFWRYSVNCAVATQYLAKEARQDAETGFAVGL